MLSYWLLGALLAAQAAFCASALPVETYQKRRAEVRAKLTDGALVLFGRPEPADLRSGFYQEANFNYLTGWAEPGAILLLTPDKETFFLPRPNAIEERFTGRKLQPGDADAAARTTFTRILAAEAFESELRAALEKVPDIYTLPRFVKDLQPLAPLRKMQDATLTLARLRMVKSAEEIALIERSAKASIEAHKVAMARTKPGLYEYEISAAMVASYLNAGCERSAYTPIVGSGPNSTVLHYSRNNRRMDAGELAVVDVAAECQGYAADITRTLPVGGKFTARQREIYEIVLAGQKKAIAAVKPGASLGKNVPGSLYRLVFDYFESKGGLGKYFTHGLGHQVGLEVHDAFDPELTLAEGMVITIEPGLYIAEENLGVRIEDMVLVTKDGGRVLTNGLPREVKDIEKALAGK